MEFIKITRVSDVVLSRRNVRNVGVLHLTTHHLIYTFSNREIWICYPVLAQVIYHTETNTLKLNCKDFQFLTFIFNDSQKCQDVYDSILRLTVLTNINQLYAFNYQPNQFEITYNSWNIYDPLKEFKRQGLIFDNSRSGPETNWRITNLNDNFNLCQSYPNFLIIPNTISDTVITHASKFRSKQRIPALSYFYKPNGTSITRCSQPLTGLKQSRSIQDEKLVYEIFKSSEQDFKNSSNLIVDCRPQTNAMAQTALGAGSEIMDNYPNATKIFLGIDNIHVMRESLNKLSEIVQDFSKPILQSALTNTKWLKYISILMISIEKLTKYFIFNKSNLIIHCSDGWDRTTQISSLIQICVDPHFRTIEGFITLIEKEWLSFGHRFNERCGHLSNQSYFQLEENDQDDGATKAIKSVTSQFRKLRTMDLTSPIFQQFLDVIYQIQRQFPNRFEFNERFIRRLVYHLYSCQYGTFLYDSQFEKNSIPKKTRSVWDYFLSRREEFTNKDYELKNEESYIIPNYKDLKWWWQLYGRSDEEMNGNLLNGDSTENELLNRKNEPETKETKETKQEAKVNVAETKKDIKDKINNEDRMKCLTPPPPSKFKSTTYEPDESPISNSKFENMNVIG